MCTRTCICIYEFIVNFKFENFHILGKLKRNSARVALHHLA